MNYEQLKKANESILTTDIQGKKYAEVNQRIKAFRMCYPEGLIETEMISLENGVVIFRARIFKEGGELLATGTAYEKENSTFINKTSFIENCETSAVGRALGMAGFGIDTSVASAEEVQNAIANQNKQEDAKPEPKTERKASAKQVELVKELYPDQLEAIAKYYKVNTVEELPMKIASALIAKKKGIEK